MEVSQKRLRDHLDQVIGAKHHGKKETEKKLDEVRNYIRSELEGYGYETEEQDFEFDAMRTAWGRVHKNKRGTNLIAEKSGQSDKVLIIATHHDTVPKSPGADDNGSGIAGLLEIAKLLAPIDTYYTIRLISFDLEEQGLIGSEFYVQQLSDNEKDKIISVVMLEMIGYYIEQPQDLPQGFGLLYFKQIKKLESENGNFNGNFLTCVYRGSSKFIARAFDETSTDDTIKVALIRDAVDIPVLGGLFKKFIPSLQNLLRSDHTPFWMRNIPAVMLTDTSNFRYKHYHLPSDTIDKINFPEFTKATQRILDMILYIDNKHEK